MAREARRLLASFLTAVVLTPGAAGAFHLGFVEAEWDGVGGVDGLGAAFSVAVSPDGAHLYVAGYGDNAVAVFTRDPTAGSLEFVEAEWDGVAGVDGLAGAYAVAVSPDGANLYAAGVLDNALAVFSRDAGTGALTFVEVQRDGVGAVDGLAGASAVAVSPNGKNVYATGFWDHSVVVFARQPTTGALTFVEVEKDGVGGVEGLANATGVVVSPDGAHVYTSAEGDSAVAAFARGPFTGALTFVEAEVDGIGGVDGLGGAAAVASSPDGTAIYAVGAYDSAVVVFARDSMTGALQFVEEQRNWQGGIIGMDGPRALTVAPDGDHVYVAAYSEGSVVSFSRDPIGAGLTFVEFRNNLWGVHGVAGARSVAVSPDARHVYVAGSNDNAVVAFVRMLFGDGFEWASTTGWSAAVP